MATSQRPRINTGLVLAGVGLIVVGILISVVTYAAAASSPSGGVYFVAFGPVIFGFLLLIRGLQGRTYASRRRSPPRMTVPPTPPAGPIAAYATPGAPPCPVCGHPLSSVPAYQRWYCLTCQAYR